MLIPWVLGYGLGAYLGGTHTTATGSLVLAATYAVATRVMLWVMAMRDPVGR